MRAALPLGLGVVGGVLGWVSGLPAGPLLGAMVAVAVYNLVTDGRLKPPPGFQLPSRVLIGATLGSLATPALLRTMGASFVWGVVLSTLLVFCALMLGLLFARLTGIDRRTALLASCPGGIAEMVALAQDSSARADLVLGMHLIRKCTLLAGAIVIVALL